MRQRSSGVIWGIVLLLAAVFILLNQFYNFTDIGIGRLIIAVILFVIIFECIRQLNFTFLPVPLAVLYVVFQEPLNLFYIKPWTLILAAFLAVIGLSILFPRKHWRRFKPGVYIGNDGAAGGKNLDVQDCDENNNPVINMNFGAASRRLRSSSLETVQLNCSFGALEIFFDQVTLSPNGAEVFINCSFGGVSLCIPKEWNVIERITCSIGGVDIDKGFQNPAQDAPRLIISGTVSLGGVEIKSI